MDILNPQRLREQAQTALRRGRDPKKLVYTYAGICLILPALILVVNLLLDNQISGTGGLSNRDSRAFLSTLQIVLPLLSGVVTLCLEFGYLSGMLRITRGQYADHTDLKVGFHRFWPLMRLMLIQGVVYAALSFLCTQISSAIFLLTPWSDPMVDMLIAMMETGAQIDDAAMVALTEAATPMLLIFVIVYLATLIPFLFRFRMASFCLLDDPQGRAMAALRESRRMMRHRFGAMLKLDLSLWFYYLALVLMNVLLYSDLLLALLEVEIGMNFQLFSTLVSAAALAVQFLIQITLRNRVEATYLCAYNALQEKPRDTGVVLGNIFDM